jgi:hypothetical protein
MVAGGVQTLPRIIQMHASEMMGKGMGKARQCLKKFNLFCRSFSAIGRSHAWEGTPSNRCAVRVSWQYLPVTDG